MLDRDTRAAIITLYKKGHAIRRIARTLKLSRNTVKAVIESEATDVPAFKRLSGLEPHLETIKGLHLVCKGNLVRVHEELEARHGIRVGYSTLTTFCRDHGIGVVPKIPAGQYAF